MVTRSAIGDAAVVFATDDGFLRPTAVAMVSMVRRLPRPDAVPVVVVDGGIEAASLAWLRSVATAEGVDLWVVPTPEDELPAGYGHVSPASHLRLICPEAVPTERLLYLDGDVLVDADISPLLTTELGGRALGAVRDVWIDTVSHPGGVHHWEALGVDPSAPYMNAGVLAIDRNAWLDADVGRRALADQHHHGTLLGDQGSLNAVTAGAVHVLDVTWNAQASLLDVENAPRSTWRDSLAARLEALLVDPAIVHFVGPRKPWHSWCEHPSAIAWRSVADSIGIEGLPPLANTAEVEAARRNEDRRRRRQAEVLAVSVADRPEPRVAMMAEHLWLPERFGDLVVAPFPAVRGVFAGLPVDDADACRALARAEAEGVTHLAIPDTSAWWLDCYPGLAARIDRDWTCTARDQVLQVHRSRRDVATASPPLAIEVQQ